MTQELKVEDVPILATARKYARAMFSDDAQANAYIAGYIAHYLHTIDGQLEVGGVWACSNCHGSGIGTDGKPCPISHPVSAGGGA